METWLKSPSLSNSRDNTSNSDNNTNNNNISNTKDTLSTTNTQQSPSTSSSFYSASRSTRSSSSIIANTTIGSTRLNPIHEANESESEGNSTKNETKLLNCQTSCSSSSTAQNNGNTITDNAVEKEKSKAAGTDDKTVENAKKTTDRRCNGQTPPNKGIERKAGSERVVKRRLINKYGGSGSVGTNNKSKTPQSRAVSTRSHDIPKSENIRTLFLSGSKKRKRVACGPDEEDSRTAPVKRCCSKSLKLDHLATTTNTSVADGVGVETEKENNLNVLLSNNNNNNDIRQDNLNDKEAAETVSEDEVFMTTGKVLQEFTTTTTNVLKDLLDIAED